MKRGSAGAIETGTVVGVSFTDDFRCEVARSVDFSVAGREELTFDVDGLRLDNVVICEREVLITLGDGLGWWIDPSGEVANFAPALTTRG